MTRFLASLEAVTHFPDDLSLEIIPVQRDRPGQPTEGVDAEIHGFDATVGSTLLLAGQRTSRLLAGLGASALDAEDLRTAGGAALRAAGRHQRIGIDCSDVKGARHLLEGVLLASVDAPPHKTTRNQALARQVLVVGMEPAEVAAVTVQSEAVQRARDLINEPPNMLTPGRFADQLCEEAIAAGLDVEVTTGIALTEMGLGGLVGVGQGSANPPALVRLTFEPPGPPRRRLGLVGKGITFDSGGLSLKTTEEMLRMKEDMGGAAVIAAVMLALPSIDCPDHVTAYLPLAENMPGGGAQRLGDVVSMRNGKTVEVVNTDSEGRLILADAISLAVEQPLDLLIDVATLTGGVVVSLGDEVAGIWSNNDEAATRFLATASEVGEPAWRLPLVEKYRPLIDSPFADLRNRRGEFHEAAAAIVAALFLREFAGSTPWLHYDIAGVAWTDADTGYRSPGGTGIGVRTLLSLLGPAS